MSSANFLFKKALAKSTFLDKVFEETLENLKETPTEIAAVVDLISTSAASGSQKNLTSNQYNDFNVNK